MSSARTEGSGAGVSALRLVLIVVLVTVGIVAGCPTGETASSSFTLRVSGPDGVRFNGQYILVANGVELREPLDAVVPVELEMTGSSLSAMFVKVEGEGTMRVQIEADGQPAAFGSTREQYGQVIVATR